ACSGASGPGGTGGPITLQGAGATFPNPLYQKWLSEYGKLHPNVRIDYQSIGSGGG
ncbi:MAG TPA: phosphate ABC transporter substrate-binding protein PstS, partial [Blastocatellia bacterium]|nr:phosphate ABC transporter substrate-binding protein PstS [Blastocatellia bacterium]